MPSPLMRAATVGSDGIAVEHREVPQPGPHEVRVRVEACGICGSDLHLYQYGIFPPGATPGHESAGVVDEVGPGVETVVPGARVAIEPVRGCGHCAVCRSGRYAICRDAKIAGIHLPGGLAEYVVVPAAHVFPVADDLDPRVAALSEPMAVAIHGLRRVAFQPGHRVLVLGAGSVGLLTVAAARRLGAHDVWVSARHSHQAELARALGATRVLDESQSGPDALDGIGIESPIDIVVETVGGQADTLSAAVAAARPGGAISVVCVFYRELALNPIPMLMKELTLSWSNCYGNDPAHGQDFAEATRAVAADREALALLITHSVPLAEVGRSFALAADRRAGAVKVCVLP